MCQQVTVCVSSLWAHGPMGRMMPAVTSMLPSFPVCHFSGQSRDSQWTQPQAVILYFSASRS